MKKVSDVKAEYMTRPVTGREIEQAMFSIGEDKAPGPDGYTLVLFKSSWNIIGNEVVAAIQEFFHNGKVLKEVNNTIISLIPKVPTASKITDYRPISCCNILYKCISRILSDRLKPVLADVVSQNQSAFVPGRRISDNILLTQEIMKNYHIQRGIPRCAFKVHIQKAYDTVDWSFLRNIILGFGLHIIDCIMICVSTISYSINIIGELRGFFQGNRGVKGTHYPRLCLLWSWKSSL